MVATVAVLSEVDPVVDHSRYPAQSRLRRRRMNLPCLFGLTGRSRTLVVTGGVSSQLALETSHRDGRALPSSEDEHAPDDHGDPDGRHQHQHPAPGHGTLTDPIHHADESPQEDQPHKTPGGVATGRAAVSDRGQQAIRDDEIGQAVGDQVDLGLALVARNEGFHVSSPSIQKSSSTGTSKTWARRNASRADGQYWPVSIELIVWRLKPTAAASSLCDRSRSAPATRNRFVSRGLDLAFIPSAFCTA